MNQPFWRYCVLDLFFLKFFDKQLWKTSLFFVKSTLLPQLLKLILSIYLFVTKFKPVIMINTCWSDRYPSKVWLVKGVNCYYIMKLKCAKFMYCKYNCVKTILISNWQKGGKNHQLIFQWRVNQFNHITMRDYWISSTYKTPSYFLFALTFHKLAEKEIILEMASQLYNHCKFLLLFL